MLPRKATTHIVVSATMDDPPPTRQEIEWRARKYGWLDAGCHFVIERSGAATPCRPLHAAAAGVRPHNATSVLIVLAGKPPFTDFQMSALETAVGIAQAHYLDAAVVGHSDLPPFNSPAPGFDVPAWYIGVRAKQAVVE